jgi:hypothetical protein
MAYYNVWNIAKAVLRRKLILISAYIKTQR